MISTPKLSKEEKIAAFIHVWGNASDSKTVAQTLGMTKASVQAKASQLRGDGYPLKHMPKGQPRIVVDPKRVCELLSISPDKLNTNHRQFLDAAKQKREAAYAVVFQSIPSIGNTPS